MLVMAMGISLTVTLYDLKEQYFSYPTFTMLNIKMSHELEFPAVTLCNISPYKMSKLSPDEAMLDYLKRESNIGSFLPPMNFSDSKYKLLFKSVEEDWLFNVSFSIKDLFIACKWKETLYFDCTKLFSPYKTEWGLCFSFNGLDSPEIHKIGYVGSILGLSFFIHVNQSDYVYARNMAAGLKIVLHNHNEEPNVMDSGYLIPPGATTYMPIERKEYKFLSSPFKAFGNEYCLDTESAGFQNHLKHHRLYSYSGCLRECKERYAYQKCQCRNHHDLGDAGPICSIERDYNCHKPAREEFNGNVTLQAACGCSVPCSLTEFTTRISHATFPANLYEDWVKENFGYTNIRENIMEVRLYYESLVYKTFEKVQKITFIDILASIRGQMGIFLGASVLTLSELMEVMVMSVVVLLQKMFRPTSLTPMTALPNKNKQ